MASLTVAIFSASSSGISRSNASSNAITTSTMSSESAPRSSTKLAVGSTWSSSTPSCSTMICLTFCSTDMHPPNSLILSGMGQPLQVNYAVGQVPDLPSQSFRQLPLLVDGQVGNLPHKTKK